MNESKHYPAPWRIEGQFDADVTVEIRAANDNLVCDIGPFIDEWTEDEIANVRLIAAAPELLEGLRGLFIPNWGSAEIARAKAAIAKAEGRS